VLHHQVSGPDTTGGTVVLLHAGVADLRMWDVAVDDLARTYHVVRCDLRGFGGSPVDPGASYSDAEDVLALLDHLGVGGFSLVGASYGGHVALQVASSVPARVERLVLLAPASDLLEPDDALRDAWRREGELVEAGDLDGATEVNVETWLGPDGTEAARTLLRTMQRRALGQQVAAGQVDNRDLDVVWERIDMPTVVVVGIHDQPAFLVAGRALAERLARAELIELPWAGHLPTLERPEEATALLRDALSR
jgi:3-oxoadipate enol-lactonase